ncbi:MAG: hypothetical protein CMP63_03445 [Flavobacteriales bacterium]|nr:hypothetical protein [Flavobacteriales bacterium]|tara:strand:- start:39826 stop:40077 length:252 start_codon:yes stop_codon:yes gene_type:complete
MKNLEGLVEKYIKECNPEFTTIDDLIIKEMHDEPLSNNQLKAIQNFYRMRIKYLTSAVNETKFSKMTFLVRLAANLVPYKDFI